MRFIPCSLKLEATMKANRIHAESRETDTVFNPTKRKNINPPNFSFVIWILILFLKKNTENQYTIDALA